MTAQELLSTLRDAGDVQATVWLRGGKEQAQAALELQETEARERIPTSAPAPETAT
ncbi:MAG TPA: hypothetical protein VFY12_11230 [Arenimonas sp.]|nr:hypothetical protein [Arenimonas sp.]